MNSLEAGDREAAAVQKTPHRVTLDQLQAKIATEYTFTADAAVRTLTGAAAAGQAPGVEQLKTLTICILVTTSGFTLLGKSAPADPENFDAELGAHFAREDALRQLWPLEGYLLREKLHEGSQS